MWTHQKVYDALKQRNYGPKRARKASYEYVFVWNQSDDVNAMILYSPYGITDLDKPFHVNLHRRGFNKDLYNKALSAIQLVSTDKKANAKRQDFDRYAVTNWDKFAEAIGLTK